MIQSRYNLITELSSEQYCVYNPLSGAFDLASLAEKNRFLASTPLDDDELNYWMQRGYYFRTSEDEAAYISKRYAEFQKESDLNPTQFIFIPNYACNFHCAYCYQNGIEKESQALSNSQVDAFIALIKDYQKNNHKDVFVTLFGGEPLLPKNRSLLTYFIDELNKNQLELSVVSNGYYLEEYLGLLGKAKIREIQVTLDGDKELHNQRRYEKPGDNSFDKILGGVRKALALKLPVHVRLIIDRETLPTLPGLALKLEEAGMLDLDPLLFKTSLGRNYELIEKYHADLLYTLKDLFFEYAKLMTQYPLIKKLHTPSFFGMTKLIQNQEMYLPNFDSCPAAKHEFVLDSKGYIYGCTASCGRPGYELGTYFPTLQWDQNAMQPWKNRSILTIHECRDCPSGVICGGGCAVIAKEQNGSVLSPNCKSVKDVIDTGLHYYKDTLLQMSNPDTPKIKKAACCVPKQDFFFRQKNKERS